MRDTSGDGGAAVPCRGRHTGAVRGDRKIRAELLKAPQQRDGIDPRGEHARGRGKAQPGHTDIGRGQVPADDIPDGLRGGLHPARCRRVPRPAEPLRRKAARL